MPPTREVAYRHCLDEDQVVWHPPKEPREGRLSCRSHSGPLPPVGGCVVGRRCTETAQLPSPGKGFRSHVDRRAASSKPASTAVSCKAGAGRLRSTVLLD